VQNDSVRLVNLLDVAGGISPKQRDDPHTRFEGLIEPTVLVGVEDQIAAKRAIGERSRLTDHVSGGSGPRQRQHTERTGIGDRGRQLRQRRHWRLDDRLFDPEELADRRSHHYHLPFDTAPSAAASFDVDPSGQTTFSYDSYDVGTD